MCQLNGFSLRSHEHLFTGPDPALMHAESRKASDVGIDVELEDMTDEMTSLVTSNDLE